MTDLEQYRAEQMKDPEFKKYSIGKQAAADLSKAVVGLRVERGMSQAELAKAVGLTQSHISIIESCEGNPSLKTLDRIARGLNMRLEIRFVPNEENAD